MGNIHKKNSKTKKQHICGSHCCQCECIQTVTNWNCIQQAPINFFKWTFTKTHQDSLLTLLQKFNLQIMFGIIVEYLSIPQSPQHPIYCHVNIMNQHSKSICHKWLYSKSYYDAPRSMRWPIELKVHVMGDGGVGKSSLILTWENGGVFPVDFLPTIEDSYRKQIRFTFDEKPIPFKLNEEKNVEFDLSNVLYDVLDSSGLSEYAAMQDQWIRESQIFFICFSWSSLTTLELAEVFLSKIERCKEPQQYPCGIILVGCKCDLKQDKYSNVTMQNVVNIIRKYNIPYVETSALHNINIDLLFQVTIYEYWIQINHPISIQWDAL